MSDSPARRRRATLYQSRQQARGIAGLVFIGVALVVSAATILLTAHQPHPAVDRKITGGVVLAVIAVVGIVFGFRAVRAGVIAGPDGITIRNPFRSIRVRWDEIERFSVEPSGPWTTGCVHLRDGTAIATWGIQGQVRFLFRNSRWATGPVEDLNALLRERRSR